MPIYYDKKRKTYYVSVYVEMKDGTKKRILRRGFKTQREAKKVESDLIFEYAQKSSDNPLFKDFADEFLERAKKLRKNSTVIHLERNIRLYFKPHFKDKKMQDIKNKDIVSFHDFLLGDLKLSVSTAKVAHGILSSIFNHAIRLEYININPCREVGNIDKKEDKRMAYWTLEEFKQFLSVVDNLKYRAFFLLMFYSGCRIGEILALEWKDINFENNTIHINKRVYDGEIDTPKTDSSIRTIKIPEHTTKAIKEYKNTLSVKEDYYAFGLYYKPMNAKSPWLMFRKFIEWSGVSTIRLHDLRHSHASYLINKGYDIQIISKRLGHTNTSITYDVYSHLYPNKEDEAVNDMEDDFKVANVIRLVK